MKQVFLGIFVGLLLLSTVAWNLQRPPELHGKIPLTWVSDDNPVRREQIDLFNQLHPDYDLRLDPNNSGMEKVIVQSLAGKGPDIFDCYDGFQLSAYVKSGIALDVSHDLKAAGIDVLKDVWPAVYPNILCEDRVYGFPTNAAVNAMWFNKDLFDKAGLPYPQGDLTWEQFIELAQRLTVSRNGRTEQFGLFCDWWNWQQFVRQWGGQIYSDDLTRCVIDSPQAVAGVQFFHDLIYVHHIMPSPVEEAAMASAGGWGSGTIKYFQGGKGAMALGGRWWLCTTRKTPELRLGAFPCPSGPVRAYRGYGRASLVNSQSPHLKGAIEFLEYMAGEPYNNCVNHSGDALAPVIKYCLTDTYLHDATYPQEDYNAVWRDVMYQGTPDQVCPYVNGQRVQRILDKQLDLVKNDQKSSADALKTAAEEINKEIQKGVDQDPALKARWLKLTRGKVERP